MKQDNIISIPGYNNDIEYTLIEQDYNFIAQHNHSAISSNTDIVIRGWYSKSIMKTCSTIVAVWSVKSIR